MKKLGVAVLIVIVLGLVILPSPWGRSLVYAVIDQQTLAGWRGAAGYTSYVTEIALILLVGGFVFVESIVGRVKALITTLESRNDEKWAGEVSKASAEVSNLLAYSQKLATGQRVTTSATMASLATMARLNLTTYNPRVWVTTLVRILGRVPGGLYGALAMILLVLKTLADAALLLA